MRPTASRPAPRAGLTLVEVCLVLALLVVISSFAVPVMQGAIQRRALVSGADLVRGAWAKARLAAMQTGQTCAFRFEPGGSRFQIAPLNQLGLPETNEMPPDNPDEQYGAADMLRIPRSRLPDGVVFATGDASASSLVTAMLPDAGNGPWSNPILFHPNGATSDAVIVLANARGQTIHVSLRGLTGISNTSDIATESAP